MPRGPFKNVLKNTSLFVYRSFTMILSIYVLCQGVLRNWFLKCRLICLEVLWKHFFIQNPRFLILKFFGIYFLKIHAFWFKIFEVIFFKNPCFLDWWSFWKHLLKINDFCSKCPSKRFVFLEVLWKYIFINPRFLV